MPSAKPVELGGEPDGLPAIARALGDQTLPAERVRALLADARRLVRARELADATLAAPVQAIVDAAVDAMWRLVRTERAALGPVRALILELAAVPGVTVPEMPELTTRADWADTERAIDRLEDALTERARQLAVHLVSNLGWYVQRASSNPTIDGPAWKGLVLELATHTAEQALGDAAGGAASMLIAGVELGTLTVKAVGFVFSFVAGKLVDALAEELTHAERNARERAQRQTAETVVAFLMPQVVLALGEVARPLEMEELRAAAHAASTSEELASCADAIRAQAAAVLALPVPTDFELGRQLLQQWVLENAGEDDRAGKEEHVSEVDWEAAVAEVTGGADAVQGRPDLFIHQTRAHLRRMGLDPAAASALVERLEQQVVRRSSAAGENAEATFAALDDVPHALDGVRVVDMDAFQATLLQEQRQASMVAVPALMVSGLSGTLSLDLSTNNDSVYVDSWDYEVTVRGLEDAERPLFPYARENAWTGEPDVYGGRAPGMAHLNWLRINVSPD